MPNWCENSLLVTGDERELAEFKEKAKSKGTDLEVNNFLPTPKELLDGTSPYQGDDKSKEELIKKYGAADWYDWQVKNWGVKWSVAADLISENPESLLYGFNSAWDSPIKFFEKISTEFPNLLFKLKYDEPGVGFMGLAKISNGKVDKQQIDYWK